jgi:hypothetical protein
MEAQGFLIGMPMAPDAIAGFLKTRSQRPKAVA